MSNHERTVTIPPEHVAYVDAMVASGLYASEQAVIDASLRSFRGQETDYLPLTPWQEEEIRKTCDEIDADPSQLIPAREVFANLEALHQATLKGQL